MPDGLQEWWCARAARLMLRSEAAQDESIAAAPHGPSSGEDVMSETDDRLRGAGEVGQAMPVVEILRLSKGRAWRSPRSWRYLGRARQHQATWPVRPAHHENERAAGVPAGSVLEHRAKGFANYGNGENL
jgi:hypothetical protein